MTSPDAALPDRLSVDPDSPFHDEALLAKGIGIRFNGVEKTNLKVNAINMFGVIGT